MILLRPVLAAWDRREQTRCTALDLIVDRVQFNAELDPDFIELDEAERNAYLAHIADDLAVVLARYLDGWLATDFPLVADWRGRAV